MPVGELDPGWKQTYPIPQSLGEPDFLDFATHLRPPEQRQLLNEVVQEGMTSLGLEGLGLHKFVDVRRGRNHHLVFSKATGEDPHGSPSIESHLANILKVRRSFLGEEPFNGLMGRLWPAIEEVLEQHNGLRDLAATDGMWLDVHFPIPVKGSMQIVTLPEQKRGPIEDQRLEHLVAIEDQLKQEGLLRELTEEEIQKIRETKQRALLAEAMQEDLDRINGVKEQFPAESRVVKAIIDEIPHLRKDMFLRVTDFVHDLTADIAQKSEGKPPHRARTRHS